MLLTCARTISPAGVNWTLAGTQHERQAELLFHLADAFGNGGLRDVEFVGGMRDIARAAQDLQEVEILFIQVNHSFLGSYGTDLLTMVMMWAK